MEFNICDHVAHYKRWRWQKTLCHWRLRWRGILVDGVRVFVIDGGGVLWDGNGGKVRSCERQDGVLFGSGGGLAKGMVSDEQGGGGGRCGLFCSDGKDCEGETCVII
ncbi:hypothetical protein DPMN_128148 [Dreissena polymorpha]|uniref:Uncharacterized protein n=1 Tax=Dreissena polymorpha TaxID=45954 RepID=A0A9D4JZF3_DREPO|nr:hypothetical protein DPMN_128148 [Dreissena polymorpha]